MVLVTFGALGPAAATAESRHTRSQHPSVKLDIDPQVTAEPLQIGPDGLVDVTGTVHHKAISVAGRLHSDPPSVEAVGAIGRKSRSLRPWTVRIAPTTLGKQELVVTAERSNDRRSTITTTVDVVDLLPPTVPGDLRNAPGSPGIQSIDVEWNPATDNFALLGYEVFFDGELVASTEATSFRFDGLEPETTHVVSVVAVDVAGNRSAAVDLSVTTLADTIPPSTVTNLREVPGSATTTALRIEWDPSTDNVQFGAYDVLLDDTVVATTNDLSYEFTGLTADTAYRLSVVAVDEAGNRSETASITASTLPDPVDPGPCIVGDDCPQYRIVSNRGKCAEVIGTAIGDLVSAASSCGDRERAFNDPRVQLQFGSDGKITISDGLCIAADSGAQAIAATCSDATNQQWTVAADGRILAADGQCLVAGESEDPQERVSVTRTDCAGHSDPIWFFLPIVTSSDRAVQAVYLSASDSIESDRANVWQTAAELNQRKWAANGTTWNLRTAPLVFEMSWTTCAEIAAGRNDLSYIRTESIHSLAEAGQFDWDTKYLIAGECDVDGTANAASSTAVFESVVLDRIEAESVVDPDNANDGDMDFTGSAGHELGHLFGLGHEFCAANPARGIDAGYQDDADRGQAEVLGWPSTVPTRGYLCNTAFFPNPDPLADYQEAIAYEVACAWLAECDRPVEELGADGRPFGCAAQGTTVFWDTTRPDLTFTLYTSVRGSTSVSVTEGLTAAGRLGTVPVVPTPGQFTHYAISLDGEDGFGRRQYCGFIEG